MSSGSQPPQGSENPIDAPPFLKTWTRVYAAVLAYLALLLSLLFSLTKAFKYWA